MSSGDYDTGEPFLSTEQMRQTPPPAPVLPPNWGRKDQGGDAWLDGDKPKRPVNKARGALFADLVIDDYTILDALMRRDE